MPTFEEMKEAVRSHHDNMGLPNRYVTVYAKGQVQPLAGGCMRGFGDYLLSVSKYQDRSTYDLSWCALPFHGDGAPITFDGLRDGAKFNECMLAHKQPFNKFIGTPRSKRWVSFLLSEHSPWKALVPWIAELDTDFINEAGFIFKDVKTVPKKLLYNFTTAIRYPWEITRSYELFLKLAEAGVPSTTALYVSINFNLNSKAETIDGPYDVQYPWSFLEETGLEAAGRFILCQPAEVDGTKSPYNPTCVNALWCVDDDKKESRKKLNDLVEDDGLSLSKLLAAIAERVEVQRQLIGA